MSNANLTLLGQLAPEYVSFSDSTRFAVLKGIAEGFVDETLFVGKVDAAVTYLIAHMLKIGERGGSAGAINSEKVGDLSRSYHKGSDKNMELQTTSYGLEYLRCRKSTLKTPLFWT